MSKCLHGSTLVLVMVGLMLITALVGCCHSDMGAINVIPNPLVLLKYKEGYLCVTSGGPIIKAVSNNRIIAKVTSDLTCCSTNMIKIKGLKEGNTNITISNEHGLTSNIKVCVEAIPFKVLKIGGRKSVQYKTFTITKCREELVTFQLDCSARSICMKDYKKGNGIIYVKNNATGEITLRAEESTNVSETLKITFEKECGEEETITVKVE